MITILPHPIEDVAAAKASGLLTTQDYKDYLLPALENKLMRWPTIAWYFEMNDVRGWKPEALWIDLKYGATHARAFRKIAIVGNSTWEKWMANVMKPFTSAEVKFFPLEQKEKAWNWVGRK